jgi:hypothetical protein
MSLLVEEKRRASSPEDDAAEARRERGWRMAGRHAVGGGGLELQGQGRSLPLSSRGDPVRTRRLALVPPPEVPRGKPTVEDETDVTDDLKPQQSTDTGLITAEIDGALETAANPIYQRNPNFDKRLVGHAALSGLELAGNTVG